MVADRVIARFLADKCPGGVLVDIGCGGGSFAVTARTYFTVAAFDVNEQAMRTIPRSVTKKWIGTGEAIPLRSNSVNLVTCLDVLEHIPAPQGCIAEAYRILKVGGFLFLRTPNPESIGLLLKRKGWFGFRDPTHTTIESIRDWTRRLDQCGFRVIEGGSNLLSDPPYVGSSRNLPEKVLFQGTNLVSMLVKPYFPWRKGENIHILAKKV